MFSEKDSIPRNKTYVGLSIFTLIHKFDDFTTTLGKNAAFPVVEPTLGFQLSFYKTFKKFNLISSIGIKSYSRVVAFSAPGASYRSDLKINHILSEELMPVIFLIFAPEFKLMQTNLFKVGISAGPLIHFNLVKRLQYIYFLTSSNNPQIDALQNSGFYNLIDIGGLLQLNIYTTIRKKHHVCLFADYSLSFSKQDMYIDYSIVRNQKTVNSGFTHSSFSSIRVGLTYYF